MLEPQHRRMLEKLMEELDQEQVVNLTVQQIRAMLDNGIGIEELESALDYAQGSISTKELKDYFIIIKVS